MLILLIIGIILTILGVVIGIYSNVNPIPTLFVLLGFLFIASGLNLLNNKNKPTAMDVYQGKTTLEITYKDGAPVDSVVVFKNKKK